MQPLTDPILRPYTAAQIIGLLTGPGLQVEAGLELVDANNTVLADISDQLQSGTISRQNYATIHGTASLSITDALVWGRDRVRPYMVLSNSSISARWNLGVYVLATPDSVVGETPQTWKVAGSDLLYLLAGPVGDSYSVAAGTAVLDAVTTAITTAVPGARILLDGTAYGKTLPTAMVWPLTSSTISTWLDVVNGLLATVSYRGVWCDWDGNYTSQPYQNPSVRAPEFTFSADDGYLSIVGESRTITNDLWQAPNWWRFIAQNWAGTVSEGAGQYTVQNLSSGPSSQSAVGRTVRKVVYVNTADQASLQSQGDQTVSTDQRVTEMITVQLSPAPMQWHFDISEYVDTAAGGSSKVVTHSWGLDLTGADGQTVFEVVG